jgi:hypothetical protein
MNGLGNFHGELSQAGEAIQAENKKAVENLF